MSDEEWNEFRGKIKAELKVLTDERRLFFAWLCAVRALPFLGMDGNFDFWKEQDRKRHLYSVLCALDFANSVPRRKSKFVAVAAAAYATYKSATKPVAYAAYAAYAADDATYDATYADANAAAYAAAANVNKNINLYNLFSRDILRIKKGMGGFKPIVSLESEIWNNFQKALSDIGCGYYGRLYENIYKNDFKQDMDALNRRLDFYEELNEQGKQDAALAAEFLEELVPIETTTPQKQIRTGKEEETMKKKYQIFISSTFTDLENERKEIIQAVFKTGSYSGWNGIVCCVYF